MEDPRLERFLRGETMELAAGFLEGREPDLHEGEVRWLALEPQVAVVQLCVGSSLSTVRHDDGTLPGKDGCVEGIEEVGPEPNAKARTKMAHGARILGDGVRVLLGHLAKRHHEVHQAGATPTLQTMTRAQSLSFLDLFGFLP